MRRYGALSWTVAVLLLQLALLLLIKTNHSHIAATAQSVNTAEAEKMAEETGDSERDESARVCAAENAPDQENEKGNEKAANDQCCSNDYTRSNSDSDLVYSAAEREAQNEPDEKELLPERTGEGIRESIKRSIGDESALPVAKIPNQRTAGVGTGTEAQVLDSKSIPEPQYVVQSGKSIEDDDASVKEEDQPKLEKSSSQLQITESTATSDRDPNHHAPPLDEETIDSATRSPSNLNSDDAIPVVMIPSFAGTRLRNWADVDCGGRGPLANFRVGGAVWLDIKRMVAQTKCWLGCLALIPETQQDDLCVTRPDEGIDAITQVDEQLPTGFLWKEAIDMLASDLGYQPSRNMMAHPYDWRLPPKKLEERDRSFSRLKLKIERLVVEYKQRNPHSPHRGVFLIAFSMGNLFTTYFFQYLEYELGRKNMELWVDEHVYALVMAGAPLLGTPSIVDSVMGGETVGLPMTKEQSRLMYTTWGSMPWMMPFIPKTTNKRHMAMNHEETDFPVRAVQLTTKDGTVLKPGNDEIVEQDGWLGKAGDERLAKMQQIIHKWYADDPLFGNGKTLRKPWTPPKGIDHIICAYGVNVATSVRHVFEEDPYYPGYFRKTDEVVNHRGDIRSKSGEQVVPMQHQRKSGDGSVPYFSLSWCHSWFESEAINITKVPAHRKYEEDEIERFQNVDILDPKQKQPIEKQPHGFNTFFTRQWIDIDAATGVQRPKSMQVWEFDGIVHRDSVTHPLLLRTLKSVLKGATAFSRTYVQVRERVMHKMWDEMEESGVLDSINGWLGEISMEGAFLSSSDKGPTSDDECRWNYAMVRCARPRYCEYRYRVGDVHLSQSCRLRETPLDRDDPDLLLQDAEAYNVSYYVGPDRVEWQTVYRPQDPGLLQPWAHLMFAFIGGAVALAILLYLVFRAYGAERLFPNRQREE